MTRGPVPAKSALCTLQTEVFNKSAECGEQTLVEQTPGYTLNKERIKEYSHKLHKMLDIAIGYNV